MCAFHPEKSIFVLQWHVESVIIKVLQEWQAGKIGHMEKFLLRLWYPWWPSHKSDDLPRTWQSLHFGNQPPSFLCSSHKALTSPSYKHWQTLGTSDFFQIQGEDRKNNRFPTQNHVSLSYQCQKNHLAYIPNYSELEQLNTEILTSGWCGHLDG